MKLDEIGERYASTLFGKKAEDLAKANQKAMEHSISDLGRRGIGNSGMAISERVRLSLLHLDNVANSLIDSHLEAHSKSGIPFETSDIDPLLDRVKEMVRNNVSHLKSDRDLSKLGNHIQDQGDVIVSEVHRRLQLHVDSSILEGRRVQRFLSPPLHALFEREFQRVKANLDGIEVGLAIQILEAAERLDKKTAESVAHCALTCRRVLKAYADAVYPATTAQPSGRSLDDAHFVNRLWQFVDEKLAKKESRELVQLSLDSLGKRIDHLNDLSSKGVHASYSEAEAERCLTQTIFLLAELTDLRGDSPR